MKIYYIISILMMLVFTACERYDEDILPIVGSYEANILGVAGPFSISVSSNYGDNIRIDAPFDGQYWYVVDADIKDKSDDRKRIAIYYQEIEPGVFIEGEGVYYFSSIQLDYTISDYDYACDFTLVATKY